MLSVVMLSTDMVSVVILNAVAPFLRLSLDTRHPLRIEST
jgi:hypothetical protein